MIRIGEYNKLKVADNVDFGAYLVPLDAEPGSKERVLLPARYIDEPLTPGQELEVFVYRDSEDRPVATTERPFAKVGEFAWLQVKGVSRIGAFLDWGLPKDLLLPFSEQNMKVREGMLVLVYVYLDNASGRVVASAKIERFLGNVLPRYRRGDKVTALPYRRTEYGYKTIVDNLHAGMVYESELYAPLVIGEPITAFVKQVRDDGKIDLTLSGKDDGRVEQLMKRIMDRLHHESDSYLPLGDNASPEAIRATFACSKKDFKKAIGHLYQQREILISDDGIRLNPDNSAAEK